MDPWGFFMFDFASFMSCFLLLMALHHGVKSASVPTISVFIKLFLKNCGTTCDLE